MTIASTQSQPRAAHAPGVVVESFLLARRNIRRFLRSPQQLISTLAFPCLLMLILLAAFGNIVGTTTGTTYIERLTPLIVLAGIIFGASGSAVSVFTDMSGGFVRRLRVLPIGRGSALGGRLLGELLRTLLATKVVLVLGHLFGFRFRTGFVGVIGFFAIALVFAVGVAWVAIAIGTSGRNEEGVASAISAPSTLLIFISAGFVPVQAFPDWARPVVEANPLSCACSALTALSQGGPTLWPVLQTLAWSAGVSAVFGTLALRAYRRRT